MTDATAQLQELAKERRERNQPEEIIETRPDGAVEVDEVKTQ